MYRVEAVALREIGLNAQEMPDMTESDALLAYLEKNGIEARTFEHPAVHTVEESKALRGDIPGLHTKNLFLRDGKKNFFLFVTDEDATINLKQLSKKIGAKGGLSFGSPEALLELLGIRPGAVSVLAVVNDQQGRVKLVLDKKLEGTIAINCHPLNNERTTSFSQQAFAKFLAATGREAVYVDLADEASPS
jgi:Ala-tRNA(Pro) deacylase